MQLASVALRPGAVVPVAVDGDEYVVWRGADGVVRSAPRICPHLDFDLGDGWVDGDELVCAGHGWAFDGAGNACKRNEAGRADPKGSCPMLHISEGGGIIRLAR